MTLRAVDYRKRTSTPAEGLALWLATNQPDVFRALVKETNRAGHLNGISDWLTGVGTSLGTAVQNVGSFLASEDGIKSLTAIGGIYLQSKAQQDALRLQTRMMQAGQPPAPVYSVGPNPSSSLPVYVDPNTGQQYSLTPQLTRELQPPMNWLPIGLAVGGIALAYFLTR